MGLLYPSPTSCWGCCHALLYLLCLLPLCHGHLLQHSRACVGLPISRDGGSPVSEKVTPRALGPLSLLCFSSLLWLLGGSNSNIWLTFWHVLVGTHLAPSFICLFLFSFRLIVVLTCWILCIFF